ncbi:hypothetical protein [Parenemella sanctibonifatiensis]|uniref:Uncharacterized protein n=1 Tax=Parenemella sanctibonifatiensis TaxID=2016505 RepID=A0A255ECV4_9ACTN|nr:hypothetical protein [Parenemella sanctibonifatiensis]OYN89389.1 hypothetical protein CGZ91_10840 [Parenemella sanctibonifatiensis]
MSDNKAVGIDLALLKRLPIVTLIWLALLAAAGVVFAVMNRGKEVLVTCNGQPMSPGDSCRTWRRRGGTSVRTYEQILAVETDSVQAVPYAGIAATLVAVAMIVAVVIRHVKDLALVNEISALPPAHVAVTTRSNAGVAFGTLAACLIVGVGAWLLWRDLIVGNRLGGAVLAFVALALAAGLLWVSRPAGIRAAAAFDDRIVAVNRSKIREIPWHEAVYTTNFESDSLVNAIGWESKTDAVPIEDEPAFTGLRAKINEAWLQKANQGGELKFGKAVVSGDTVRIGRTNIPGANIAQVTFTKTRDGMFMIFRDAGGAELKQLRVVEVPNPDVLFAVLRHRFGTQI